MMIVVIPTSSCCGSDVCYVVIPKVVVVPMYVICVVPRVVVIPISCGGSDDMIMLIYVS